MAVRIECIADTDLRREAPDYNNGQSLDFGVGDYSFGAGSSSYFESLIKFQKLPSGTYSKIYLYLKNVNSGGTFFWNKPSEPWEETVATYANTNRYHTRITAPDGRKDGKWQVYDLTGHYDYLKNNNDGFALTPRSGDGIWFCSRESEFSPYIVAYTASDIMPPFNLEPTTTQSGKATFSWDFDGTQSAHEIQYRQCDNRTTITTNTLDSGILDSGKVYWQVRVKNNEGIWSAWSVEGEFDFTKVSLGIPSNLQPSVAQKGTVTISWANEQGSATSTQTAYEVQYSYNQIDWNIIRGTGAGTQHVIPIGTFTFDGDSTTIYYRVRVKNNYNAWSDWSSSNSFLYYSSNPKKPTNLTLLQEQTNLKVAWNYAPNADEPQSSAEIEYSFDNAIWNSINHVGSATTYTIVESILNNTTVTYRTVYVRIRTKNSLGGISVYSDTKQVNYKTSKPIQPSNLQPFGQQLQGAVSATWDFIGTGRDDTQKAFELMYKCEGQGWITKTGTTTSQYLFSDLVGGTVLWKVRVQSTFNIWSDWSSEASFIYAVPPTKPVIKSSNIFDVSKPVIVWDSFGQTSFRLQVYKGAAVYFDTQEVTSSANSYVLEKALENNSSYVIRLRVKNKFALWSDWAEQVINTAFKEPNQPNFTLLTNFRRASIHLHINNPIVSEIAKNEVFRRRYDNAEWEILGEVEPNGQFIDYTLMTDTQYEYKVRAITFDGGYKDSDVQNTSVKVRNTQLANTSNYAEWVELKYNPNKSFSKSYVKKIVHYVGRENPVVINGLVKTWNMSLSFIVLDREILENLLKLIDEQEILLLRDSNGRNKYVFVTQEPQIAEKYAPILQWEVSFEVTEVDF